MDVRTAEDLERALKALASLVRIQLLVALQEPRRVTELDLAPGRPGPWGSKDRPMSRQALLRHVQELMELGVVEPIGRGPTTRRYVVNHARLFHVTEQLRQLATVRSTVPVQAETLDRRAASGAPRVEGPQLVLVRGVHEGQVYPLAPPSPPGGWTLGRRAGCHVALDYDPYVSGVQARVILRDGGHYLVDEPGRRNETLLNWRPLAKGAVAPLEPGDLIGVGMSMLLFRR